MARYALVVDDTRIAATTIAQALTLLGYQAEVAYSPRVALESISKRVPDVILLDINMPGIDGVEVCRYLRRDPRTETVPIVAMSSEVEEETVDQVYEAGANVFLAKPIDIDILERALNRILNPR